MIPLKKIELPHVDAFLSRFQSEGTIRAYRADLECFEAWVTGRGIESIRSLNVQHVMEYRAWLGGEYTQSGANRRLSCLKSYLRTLVVLGVLDRNPGECIDLYPNRNYRPTEGLESEDVERILKSIDLKTETGRMHSAVLHCLFYLGLRRAEVCALKVSDLGASQGVATLSVLGKGNKRRVLPLPEPVFSALKLYLESTRARSKLRVQDATEPLFSSTASNTKSIRPLSHNSITKIWEKYTKAACIEKRTSPHSARVTAVTNALAHEANVMAVQEMGGWSSLDMVLRYNRARLNLKNSAVFAVNYGGKK